MKLASLAFLAASCALVASEAVFDKGGVTFDFAKASVRNMSKDSTSYPMSVHLTPSRQLDDTFAMAPGAPGIMAFIFKRNQDNVKFGKLELHIEMPSDFTIRGTCLSFKDTFTFAESDRDGGKWRNWSLEMTGIVHNVTKKAGAFHVWNMSTVLVTTSAPAMQRWEGCRYYVTSTAKDGSVTQLTDAMPFTLLTTAAWEPVKQSKFFHGGLTAPSMDLQFQQKEAQAILAKFIGETGSRIVASRSDKYFYDQLHANGVDYVLGSAGNLANGFRIGPQKDRPANVNFLDKNGVPAKHAGKFATCPAVIYLREPYYTDVILPDLLENLKNHDGAMPNWEPYMFNAKGCFCQRCKGEYAKWAKVPLAELDKQWPAAFMSGLPGRDKIIDFRGWQHAQLIRTINQDFIAAGFSFGICPEVGIDQIIRFKGLREKSGDFLPYAYAGDIPWLNIWGPYIWYPTSAPYVYVKGANARYLELITRSARDYHASFPQRGKAARIMAMPQGRQSMALAQPEGMTMDQISAWLAGFDASILYFFPRGYDIRFWKALADANKAAWLYDDLVLNGKPWEGVSVSPRTPFPEPGAAPSSRYMPDVAQAPLLQARAFAKDGVVLAAVANFWEKGDCVFTLKVPGLKPNERYLVREQLASRCFCHSDKELFCGKDLADGIALHVGAMRWGFFQITAGAAAKAGEARVVPADMDALLAKRLPEIQAAAAEEAKRDAAIKADLEVGEFTAVRAGTLKGDPGTDGNAVVLNLSNGDRALQVSSAGLAVINLTVNGIQHLADNNTICAFWNPGKHGHVILKNFRITGQELSKDALIIRGTYKFTDKNYPEMAGVIVHKTLTIRHDLKHIHARVDIENTNEDAQDMGYRWQFMTSSWSAKSNGDLLCANGDVLKRPCYRVMLACPNISDAAKSKVPTLFSADKDSMSIAQGPFVFKGKDLLDTRITFEPAAQLEGVGVWDTPNMPVATFEPFYAPVTINPGAKVTYSTTISIE